MEYLLRFSQSHETFRLAEIQALATLEDVELEIVSYITDVGGILPSPSVYVGLLLPPTNASA